MIYRMVMGDLLRFATIYMVFVMGFSQGKTIPHLFILSPILVRRILHNIPIVWQPADPGRSRRFSDKPHVERARIGRSNVSHIADKLCGLLRSVRAHRTWVRGQIAVRHIHGYCCYIADQHADRHDGKYLSEDSRDSQRMAKTGINQCYAHNLKDFQKCHNVLNNTICFE